jgi:hypothetical protein
VLDGLVRGTVGPGHATEVQTCYANWASACLLSQCDRALLVGSSAGDEFAHLAARDALGAMVLAGLPQQFRLALVAQTAHLIAVYDAVVVEAQRRGLDARRFRDEEDALNWLRA